MPFAPNVAQSSGFADSPSSGGLVMLLAVALLFYVACDSRTQTPPAPGQQSGEALFAGYCASCHQYDGQGAGEAPPLDGAPWVTGPPETLVKIVLHGLRGEIEVHGATFDREMPGFGSILSNEDVAGLASYVRKRFGSIDDPVTSSFVGSVRQQNAERTEYWPAEELEIE